MLWFCDKICNKCRTHMLLGYARVSTEDQNLESQLTALHEAGCRKIFQEKLSGAQRQRPELAKMLEQLRDGDTVVVWKLDRLARSTRDLLDIADIIAKGEAGLKSLTEPWADTTSPAGRMVLTVFAGIAEFERALIKERTGAGRAAAMKRGVRFGRPPKLTAGQAALASRLLDEGTPAREVADYFEVHKATIYRFTATQNRIKEAEPA
jgi:DNA invertase Pin-like site-specific DNA recombinase